MISARVENARTLAALLGLGEEQAASLLAKTIAVTADDNDAVGKRLAAYAAGMLRRTVDSVVTANAGQVLQAELVVGAADPVTDNFIRVSVTSDEIVVGRDAPSRPVADVPAVALLLAACYAAGAFLNLVLDGSIGGPGSVHRTLRIPLTAFFGHDQGWITAPVDVGEAHLAGAGAVGNGFLTALSLFDVHGTLHIVDPDIVTSGSLNRCLWFEEADIGLSKAKRLAEVAQASVPGLRLLPADVTLQQVRNSNDPRWLKRLVVAVDSRRARRGLQAELPGEVFDASTTGVSEIVFHHYRVPTDEACLGCIYHEAPDELARERHVAESLGVSLAEVQQHLVDANAARKIQIRYPHLELAAIEGQAYDSLFKAFCAQAALATPEQHQVFAPFAFVSVLAGTLLGLEFVRRLALVNGCDYNYWRISPWHVPVVGLKDQRPRHAECEFCGNRIILSTTADIWAD